MNLRFVAVAAVVLSGSWSLACGAQTVPARGPVAPVELGEPARLVRTYQDCDPEAADPPCTYISFAWPEVVGAGEAATSLAGFIDGLNRTPALAEEPPPTIDRLADEFLDEYAAFRAEFPDNDFPWVIEREVRGLWQDARLMTLVYEEYSYLGGAHPNTALGYWVIDRTTGRQVALEQLLVDGYRDRLTEIAEAAFRRDHEVEPEISLEAAGFWFEDDVFALNDNWAIDGDGLRFYFNPYEVAAYVAGPTEILLPRATIAELIRPDGLWR